VGLAHPGDTGLQEGAHFNRNQGVGDVRAIPLGASARCGTVLERILRLPDVLRARGRSRSAHYLDIRKGLFTPPVHVGERAVGWPAAELTILNAARIAGKTTEELRQLVASLVAARNSQGVLV
jgi:prophage regulatory protein